MRIWKCLALLLTGLVVGLSPTTGAAQPKPPIKVGLLTSLTGPLASLGEYAKTSLELAFEEVGNQVGGRRLTVVIEDGEGKPDVGRTKVKKLIEQDKIDILLGPVSSAVALAIRDYVVSKGTPWLTTFATTPSLTRELAAPNLFRPAYSAEQPQYTMGVYFRQKLGYEKIAVVGLDYVAGRAEANAFMEGFKAAGGKAIQEIFLPLGAPDPAPFISKIKPEALDALAGAAIWGNDAIRFVKGLDEYGIKGRLPIIVTNSAVSDGNLLPSQGRSALGIKSYGVYANGLQTPENRRFVQAFLKKTGKAAGGDAYVGYIGVRAAIEALKNVDGKIEDTAGYLSALRKVEFVGPAGPFKFDKNQNAIVTVYLLEVRETGGELHNAIVEVVAQGVAQR